MRTIITSLLAVMSIAGCTPKTQLHIYTWSDYIDPDIVQQFEKSRNCQIVIDTFDSNETMYAKLKAGASGYDIVIPSSYQIQVMAKEGMLLELDHSKLPNVKKNFDKAFSNQILDPTFKYNVPYAMTYCGFCYRKDKIPSNINVNSWRVLDNKELSGKVSFLDDIREVVSAGLIYSGCQCNSVNKEELNHAVNVVLNWKKNIKKFDSESYRTEVPSGSTWLAMGYSCDAIQLIIGDEENGIEARQDIGFALPEEGFTVSCDEMVIPTTSKHVDLAYDFINFMYDPVVAKKNIEYICAITPVKEAVENLDDSFKKLILIPEDKTTRAQLIRSLDAKTFEMYNKAWDKIKSIEK